MMPQATRILQVSAEQRRENSAYHPFLKTVLHSAQLAQKSQQLFALCDHLSCGWEGATSESCYVLPHSPQEGTGGSHLHVLESVIPSCLTSLFPRCLAVSPTPHLQIVNSYPSQNNCLSSRNSLSLTFAESQVAVSLVGNRSQRPQGTMVMLALSGSLLRPLPLVGAFAKEPESNSSLQVS